MCVPERQTEINRGRDREKKINTNTRGWSEKREGGGGG